MPTTETIAAPARSRLPSPAVRRARAMIEDATRHAYAGGSHLSRDIALWRPPNRSADADIMRDQATVRARARDLERNHPYARQTIRMSRLGVVGTKLKYSCRPDWRFLGIDEEEARRWAQEFERVWESYAHSPNFWIDAGRRVDFTGLMGLVHDADVMDGEALVAFEWDESRRWRSCWQVVDVDRLCNPNGAPDSNYLRSGIALDERSAPVGYHIRNGHPHDIGLTDTVRSMTWSFVPRWSGYGRANICHTYEMHRAGQTRGMSTFAPVIRAMRMGQEYGELALAAAALQASFAAVLTSAAPSDQIADMIDAIESEDSTGNAITDYALEHLRKMAGYYGQDGINFMIAGTKVQHLAPGDTLDLKNPGQHMAAFAEFQSAKVKEYAAGTGTDPIAVSQDFANVNYSSAKMAAAINYRAYAERRRRLGQGVGMHAVGAHLDELVFSGGMKLPKGLNPLDYFDAKHALVAGEFLTQGAPNLDPLKEIQALQNELMLGVSTIQQACAERGVDYLDMLDQLAREKADFEARGLPPPMLMGMVPAAPESGGDKGSGKDKQKDD